MGKGRTPPSSNLMFGPARLSLCEAVVTREGALLEYTRKYR